jgi:parvulin-like peptidyl-prolyl isomerase
MGTPAYNSLKRLVPAVVAWGILTSVAVADSRVPLPDPVALVNGAPISRADLRREVGRLERAEGTGGGSVTSNREQELLRGGLDNLIARELLYQEARKSGVKISPEKVEAEIANLKGNSDNAVEFAKTLGELQLSEVELKRQTERAMTARAFIDGQIAPRSEPQEMELKNYFERNPQLFKVPEQSRFRHILIKFDPSWQLEKKQIALEKARKIRERLQRGEAFAVVAREQSDCRSRDQGGDLGWFKRGQLAPFLERIVFTAPLDAISEPVDDRFGYHLIQVTGRRPARTVDYAEARPKIREYLHQEQAVRQAREFADKKRAGSKIEIFLPSGAQ